VRERWERYVQEAFVARWRLVRFVPVAGRALVLGVAAVNVVAGLLPVAFVIASGITIGRVPPAVTGGVDSPEWGALTGSFVIAAAAFIAQQLLLPAQTALGELVKQRVDGRFHRDVAEAALRAPGLGALEDPVAADRLSEATQMLGRDYRTPGDAIAGLLRYVSRYTSLAGYCVVLGVAVGTWWPPAIIALSTMVFRFGHRGGMRMWMRLWPVVGPHRRRRDYFRRLGIDAHGAKELRVFGLTEWVVDNFRKSAVAALMPMWRARRRASLYKFLGFAFFGVIVDVLVLAYVARSAAEGSINLTELALGLQAAVAAILLGTFYQESDEHTQFGMDATRALAEFEAEVDAHSTDDDGRADALDDAGGLPRETLHLDNVSFSYPGSMRKVLDDIDLTLRAGECTAIVGINGAGKTTLVKLLARLYEPTSGTVRVDDRDVRDYDVDAWRRQIGVIFQDFTRYELSVADNIAFGAVERPVDRVAVRAAAARAGILDVIEALPRGLDTVLARHHTDGADLSGGQWQRVAIARALYAVDAGARVLVLDEPTAALDVRAEAEFFDRFVELTRGVTTVLISHRFSSVRRADRIVVLEHGRVVEDGTHESLLVDGGRYADLFRLQAERFDLVARAEDDDEWEKVP